MEAVFLDSSQFREFALEQAQFFGAEIPNLVGAQQEARISAKPAGDPTRFPSPSSSQRRSKDC